MRNVVITGGSRGIGAAAVRRFSAGGDRVWFLYASSHGDAKAVAAETGATAICADVTEETAVAAAFSQIGPVDVLVNNAGIADYSLVNCITPDRWRRVLDVNVNGMFYCIRAALPSMLHRQGGVILNLSSMWGLTGGSCEVAYSTSKAAVIGLTKSLAKELGPSHIRVNAVAPGVIRTEMVAGLGAETLAGLREETALERLGEPEDVAAALWFLSSEDAGFITGEVLNVSGGFVV